MTKKAAEKVVGGDLVGVDVRVVDEHGFLPSLQCFDVLLEARLMSQAGVLRLVHVLPVDHVVVVSGASDIPLSSSSSVLEVVADVGGFAGTRQAA